MLKGFPGTLREGLVPQRPEQRHHEDQHGDDVVRRVRLAYNRVLLGDRWHQILQNQSLVLGRWSFSLQRNPLALANDRGPTTNDGFYTLNHGVIHTYLICHASRSSIFAGRATMLSTKNIMMEYCSKLMRL